MLRILFFALALAATSAAAPPPGLDPRSESEATLQALRSEDIAKVLLALKGIPAMKDYPDSAQGLLPALLWIKEGGIVDLAQEADIQARALGWPAKYCLSCLRKFAARQDKVYKLMGLSALAGIVWRDPEAMLALVEISQAARGQVSNMARGVALKVEHGACGSQREMEAWNERMEPLMARMRTAFGSGDWRLKPLAKALLRCQMLRADLRQLAQAAADRR